MSRNSREHTTRKALAARMSLQFDHALSEAAETLAALGAGCHDSGDDAGGDVRGDPDRDAGDGPGLELLPLELQLADLERAVDTMLEQRDRVLYGYGNAAKDAAGNATTRPGGASDAALTAEES